MHWDFSEVIKNIKSVKLYRIISQIYLKKIASVQSHQTRHYPRKPNKAAECK